MCYTCDIEIQGTSRPENRTRVVSQKVPSHTRPSEGSTKPSIMMSSIFRYEQIVGDAFYQVSLFSPGGTGKNIFIYVFREEAPLLHMYRRGDLRRELQKQAFFYLSFSTPQNELAPVLCRCQCIAVVFLLRICILYIPTFVLPVSGCIVCTIGRV